MVEYNNNDTTFLNYITEIGQARMKSDQLVTIPFERMDKAERLDARNRIYDFKTEMENCGDEFFAAYGVDTRTGAPSAQRNCNATLVNIETALDMISAVDRGRRAK
ncbi:MAG: hypothetical protein ACI9P9_000396 [Patescibacteria group bacterium]|jgi:hypothetical protein